MKIILITFKWVKYALIYKLIFLLQWKELQIICTRKKELQIIYFFQNNFRFFKVNLCHRNFKKKKYKNDIITLEINLEISSKYFMWLDKYILDVNGS